MALMHMFVGRALHDSALAQRIKTANIGSRFARSVSARCVKYPDGGVLSPHPAPPAEIIREYIMITPVHHAHAPSPSIFSVCFILWRVGKFKAQAHHTSTLKFRVVSNLPIAPGRDSRASCCYHWRLGTLTRPDPRPSVFCLSPTITSPPTLFHIHPRSGLRDPLAFSGRRQSCVSSRDLSTQEGRDEAGAGGKEAEKDGAEKEVSWDWLRWWWGWGLCKWDWLFRGWWWAWC